jgi:hypothetical protein
VGDIGQPGGGIGPVSLCKALRRIETKGNRLACDYCSLEGFNPETLDRYDISATKRVLALLPNLPKEALHLNHDPRGYYLKVDDEYIRANGIDIHRDMGGYGILAPEFDGNN